MSALCLVGWRNTVSRRGRAAKECYTPGNTKYIFSHLCKFQSHLAPWLFSLSVLTAVHCNLSQNGIDHQMCPEDMTSQLEEDEESVDAGPVLLDDDSPGYRDLSPPPYQRRSLPHRSVSESELTRVSLSVCLSVALRFKNYIQYLVNYVFFSTSAADQDLLYIKTTWGCQIHSFFFLKIWHESSILFSQSFKIKHTIVF